jgi:predicted RNA binding protein YcfA (HicA-like mRNA interferase family)
MSSPNDLPGEIKRKKFIKALERCGFVIDKVGGNGSHYKAIWPRNNKSITIQQDLPKPVLRYILKEIDACTGITWNEIKAHL